MKTQTDRPTTIWDAIEHLGLVLLGTVHPKYRRRVECGDITIEEAWVLQEHMKEVEI